VLVIKQSLEALNEGRYGDGDDPPFIIGVAAKKMRTKRRRYTPKTLYDWYKNGLLSFEEHRNKRGAWRCELKKTVRLSSVREAERAMTGNRKGIYDEADPDACRITIRVLAGTLGVCYHWALHLVNAAPREVAEALKPKKRKRSGRGARQELTVLL